MDKSTIKKLIDTEHPFYGLTKTDVSSLKVLSLSGTMKKIDFFKSQTFKDNLEYTRDLLKKTQIKDFSVYHDLGFILAIFSRETGPIYYRYYKNLGPNPGRKYVTSGADVHSNGIAGFDFMMSGGQSTFHKKNFADAGISISSVLKSELKPGKTDRAPGRIEVRHFLFAAFSMLAYCEKRLIARMGKAVYDSLDIKAKRTWLALYFALPGGVVKMESTIKGIRPSTSLTERYSTLILDSSTPPPNSKGTLRRARGAALKGHVYELTCNNIFENLFGTITSFLTR